MHTSALRAVLCYSPEEFAYVCTHPNKLASDIPIICNPEPWPVDSLAYDSVHWEEAFPEPGFPRNGRKKAFTRNQRYTGMFTTPLESSKVSAAVVAPKGSAGLCATVLAAALHLPLRLVSATRLLDETREQLAESPVMLTVLRDDASDELLFGLLEEFGAALKTERPWEALPRFTLITGRDIASLSWVVAKLVAQIPKDPEAYEAIRFADFRPGTDLCVIRELEGSSDSLRVSVREADLTEVIRSFSAPANVVSYSTHGADACAKGGCGMVLCGLRSNDVKVLPTSRGVLACGRGHSCPRGPSPVPLKDIQAKILILCSCNGLRLADSSLMPDFNLGLAFLDGLGRGYVSTLHSPVGLEPASLCFLAAMASGATLAESTSLANAFLTVSGVESSLFLAVGLLDDTAYERPGCLAPHQGVERLEGGDTSAIPLLCDGRHLVSFSLTDPWVLETARKGNLSLAIEPHPPTASVAWFYRVESFRKEPWEIASAASVRVFLFRFPDALESVTLTLLDGEALRIRCIDALRGLERWIEIWRLSGLFERHSDTFAELLEIHHEASQALAENLRRLRWNGAAPGQLADQAALLERSGLAAGTLALEDFLPSMTGGFYLTNSLMRQYEYNGAGRTTCSYCDGVAVRKWLVHSLHAERRVVVVCPRCGIVSDVRENGPIAAVLIHAPDEIETGNVLEVVVYVVPGKPCCSIRLVASLRVCTNRLLEIVPEPERIECDLAREQVELRFRLGIPRHLPPHQYEIKVLVVSNGEAAFATKLLFVR